MSKVGGALPAWYWPEGIPRRSPVPQQTLDRLIKRASARSADAPAIVWPDRELSYGALLDTAASCGAAIGALATDREVVAVAEADPGEALVLMLSILLAGKRALLADVSASEARLTAQLALAGASLVLTANDPGSAGRLADVRVATRSELSEADSGVAKPRPMRPTAPAAILPFGDELAVHSHYSLAAMAMSFAAFVPQLRELALVSPPPLWRWEALTVMLAALVNGRQVVVRGLAELESTVATTEAYALLLRGQADELIDAKRADAALQSLRHVFVSTGYFRPRWRRHLESLCGREVLPVWGLASIGPTVAAHPTWFPFDAHGIPLVNVRVLPVDPASGELSVVPWEMLERAEIGVETPAAMTGFVREDDTTSRTAKVIRTRVDASVDHVGVVTLHKPPKGSETHDG